MTNPLNVAFAMGSEQLREHVLPDRILDALPSTIRIMSREPMTDFSSPKAEALLPDVHVLVTGWGAPRVDHDVLDRASRLKLVAHAAGSVKAVVAPDVWKRGIHVTTAADANAEPVAHFTLAMILLAGKQTFRSASALQDKQGAFRKNMTFDPMIGNNGRVIGIHSASRIGRRVIELLRPYPFTVLLHHPSMTEERARNMGMDVELVSLDDLFARSDIVSTHAPSIEATRGVIGKRQFDLLRDGGTFVNTARPSVVDDAAMREEARNGRLTFILDVTAPEPLPTGDQLYALPNVFITPHIAGSLGNEIALMGASALDEVKAFAEGAPLIHPLTLQEMDRTA